MSEPTAAYFDSQVRFQVMVCARCGIAFGVPTAFADTLRGSEAHFYCPHGHSLQFVNPEKKSLRDEAARRDLEARAARAETRRLRAVEKLAEARQALAEKLPPGQGHRPPAGGWGGPAAGE